MPTEADVKEDIMEAAKLGIFSPTKVMKMLAYLNSHVEDVVDYDSMSVAEISDLIAVTVGETKRGRR